jgi:hypothetical protein
MCAYDYTNLQLGRKHESKDAKSYTYQSQTVKPVFMADTIASVTELIAAGHCVDVPQVVESRLPKPLELKLSGQSLCGIK